ncbi:universal stress protein [Streptosporangium sp. NBC_01639]|uniref:universal stress protein n=1 Tax=Streptosporangium sp. NBC_01639 TaxID=2975948 RepID=UPI0038700876|nr:universal stress protein [Streptosporangium sp. NBC_01639]
MKIEHVLAGFVPEPRCRDGLALAVLLARQSGARLTVAYVHAPAWTTPGPGKVDAEWQAYVAEDAAHSLEQARRLLADVRDVPIDYVLTGNRGSGRGLVQLAGRSKADVVVIGPAPGGVRGRIRLGSTADQLLHASPVPVALAPRGYGEDHPPGIRRLTVAYRRDPASDEAVLRAAVIAARMGVPLRLITLVVRGGRQARMEEEMLNRLRERVMADLRAAARGHGRLEVEVEVLEGRNVAAALGATDCEGAMLVCASSETGPLRRVFLGDISSKIIRSAPCPVMMLPRNPPRKPGILGEQGKL